MTETASPVVSKKSHLVCVDEKQSNYEEGSENSDESTDEEGSESSDDEESESPDDEVNGSNNEEENVTNDDDKLPTTWSESRKLPQLLEQQPSVLQEVQKNKKRYPERMEEKVAAKKPKVAMLETPKALVTFQSTMKIHDIQFSLQSAFAGLEYYKERDEQFEHMKAQCEMLKSEREQLGLKEKKMADELQKTKQDLQAECAKNKKMVYELKVLREQFSDLESDTKCVKEINRRIQEEKKKMAEDLEYTRLELEYHKRIDHLKGALKSVSEFPGLKKLFQQKNNSDSEGSKAQAVVDPKVSTKRRYVLKVHEIDDSSICPICFEPWSESTEHRMCSLACGHFFGKSCITSWINKTGTDSSKCPQCLRSATVKDIRNHYMPEMFVVGDEKI